MSLLDRRPVSGTGEEVSSVHEGSALLVSTVIDWSVAGVIFLSHVSKNTFLVFSFSVLLKTEN